MRCEVCGHKIHTDPVTALIEGARLTVCIECSKHGKIVTQDEYAIPKTKQVSKSPFNGSILIQKKKTEIKVEITQEIVEDFSVKIRQAREKLGLTHEDLGKKINEKSSVIGKLETGKMVPNNILATKLEHALKIKLLIPVENEKPTATLAPKAANRELTLGDLIKLDKTSEEQTERKQS